MSTEEEPDPFDGLDESAPIPERRQYERVPVRIEIRFTRAVDAARALRAYSLNLSVGGLCLRTAKEYELGTPLRLAMTVEQTPFDLGGSVAWIRGGTIGVRFDPMPESERLRLTEVMGSLKRPA